MIGEVPQNHPLLVQFREDPYPLYRYLLENAPVQWNEVLHAWTLAQYADVVSMLTDSRFSADRTFPRPPVEGYAIAKSILVSNPPDHTRLRALVSNAFTPRMIDQLRPRIVAIVGELLERMAEHEQPVDLIAELAYPLPVVVIAELLGVPAEDRVKFQEWSAALAASLDPLASADVTERVGPSRDALHVYLREIIAERRSQPRSDLISALVAAEEPTLTRGERGDTLSEPELVVMCTLLLIAGHETTVNLIGNGVLALLEHPDQLERLRADSSLIGSAIEELLRFDPPVQLTGRIAAEQIQIGGKTIAAGDWVLPLLGAANHDPAQFADPDALDLGRNPNPHVAFGRGIHFCLGAPLARLEGQVAIGMLARRFKSLSLAGEPVRRGQITLRGLRSLPVSVA